MAMRIEAWLQAELPQLPLWAPVALGLGIVFYFTLPWASQRLACGVGAAAAIALGTVARGASARLLVWAGVLVGLGLMVAGWRSDSVAGPVLRDRYQGEVTGTVEAVELRSGRGQVRFQVAPDNIGLPGHVRISLKANVPPGLVPGAKVALRAMLSPPAGPSYPGGYDFARRAWFAGIGATGYPLGPVTVTAAPPPRGPEAWLDALRARLTRRIEAAVGGPAGAISAAFVTGDQGAIPEDVAQAMRYSGMAHLLSISGLHIAIVVGGAMWLTRRTLALVPWIALRWPVKAIAAGAAAVAGIGYTILAGGEVPTVRSCIATVIVLIGIVLGREALTLRLIAAGAFLILLVRPEALLGPSFQLTFAAVTGLVALYQSRAGRWLAGPGPEAGPLARLVRHGVALVGTGLVAEAMLSATALFHFNQTGTYGVVANLVAIPLTSFVIMPLLMLALLLDIAGIGAPVWWLLGRSMDVLIAIASHVAAWPGSVVRVPLMPTPAYALLVIGGLWLCLWQSRVRWLGAAPIVAGAVIALTAPPPDLLVSADGRQVALLILSNGRDGARLALLRDHAGDYIRDMWGGATAATADAAIADLPGARCSLDACVATIDAGRTAWPGRQVGQGLRLLATLSKDRIARPSFGPACAAADIVVSDRRLPSWCVPRWLKLDRTTLGNSGAVAIWLGSHRVESVAERVGDHPWMPQAQVYRPNAGGFHPARDHL